MGGRRTRSLGRQVLLTLAAPAALVGGTPPIPRAPRPKRAPERPLRARKASTAVAWPLRTAPTAWPIMPPGAAPPGPDTPQ